MVTNKTAATDRALTVLIDNNNRLSNIFYDHIEDQIKIRNIQFPPLF